MKLFSVRRYFFLASLAAITLAGCAAPEAQVAADGTKVAAVKCRPSSDAPLGTMIRRDCGAAAGDQSVDKEGFMNALQTPGSISSQR